MNPIRFWFAIFALLGFVLVAPAWVHFTGPAADGLPAEVQWLVLLVLPLSILFTLASWAEPGGS
jgi:hypothetical protein